LKLKSFPQSERKESQMKKKKAIWYADPMKMQDCSAKLHYFNPNNIEDVEIGKFANEIDRTFL